MFWPKNDLIRASDHRKVHDLPIAGAAVRPKDARKTDEDRREELARRRHLGRGYW